VLRLLPAGDLARVHCSSRLLSAAAAVDDLWRGLWPPSRPPPAGVAAATAGGWRAAVGLLRRSMCVECGEPTPHEFALLRRRLCAPCELRNPTRYRLATETEALDRFGIDPAALDSLPSVFVMGRRWFLTSSLAAMSRGKGGGPQAAGGGRGAGGPCSDRSEDSDSGGDSGSASESEGVDGGASSRDDRAGTGHVSGGSGARGADEPGGDAAAAGAAALHVGSPGGAEGDELEGRVADLHLQQQRAAKREERKRAKKQVGVAGRRPARCV
jgi:hypothetical protein